MTKHAEYNDLLAPGQTTHERTPRPTRPAASAARSKWKHREAPVFAGYCHCRDCQAWSAAPVNAFSLWKSGDVRVTKGASDIGTYNKTENSYRKFCKTCGGHIMTEHPRMRLTDVYANLLRGYTHQPTLHVNYASKTLR